MDKELLTESQLEITAHSANMGVKIILPIIPALFVHIIFVIKLNSDGISSDVNSMVGFLKRAKQVFINLLGS